MSEPVRVTLERMRLAAMMRELAAEPNLSSEERDALLLVARIFEPKSQKSNP